MLEGPTTVGASVKLPTVLGSYVPKIAAAS